MKTLNNLNKKVSVVLSALVLVALSSCGKVPTAYRGAYIDQASGTKLELDGREGKWTEAGGREITAKADSLQFEALAQAKPGIYTRAVAGDDKLMELFWIVPDVASRQEVSGFAWFTAEIVYTRLQSDAKDPVPTLTVEHCRNGMLMLDLPTQTWSGGCGPEAVPMNFTRAAEKK
jgi:hypothetical protein